MLFHPESDLMWDTWLIEHEGLFYLFYIRLPTTADPAAQPGTMGASWDAVSLATSPDLLHWTERGPVLEKDPDAAWLGTGMVHRSGGRFVMNFSEERPVGRQTISFATSADLLIWERLPHEQDLLADGTIYQADAACSADPLPRWDSIGIIPPGEPGEPFLGMLAADLADPPLAGQCAVLGLLSSPDGISWQPLPPATGPGLFPSYEVAEHLEISARHFVLFSTNTTAGARFVPGDPLAQGGTYYVVSDAIQGPYVPPPVHPLLHGHRIAGREFGTYVGRPITTSGGELLFYHHWAAEPPDGWWGPPKRLVERRPFVLGLDYWPGCEALKDPVSQSVLTSNTLEPLPSAGAVPVVRWAVDAGDLACVNAGGTHGARWHDDASASGRIVETGVRVDAGRGLGLWVKYRVSESMFFLSLNSQSQQLELGSMSWLGDGSSLRLRVEEVVECQFTAGVTHQLRLLIRNAYAEAYLDDQLIKSFTCQAELDPATLGFFADLADGVFAAPHRWTMTL
jgi:hypothetical protein